MLDKLKGIEERFSELGRMLMEVGDDYQRAAELNKERIDLEPIADRAQKYRKSLSDLEEARTVISDSKDADLLELARAEVDELQPLIETLENEIKKLLIPRDPRDEKNVIMEIRAGTGGDEAALFASDLFRMYKRYTEKQGWKVEVMSQHEIGIGGFKEITFLVKGAGAYSKLKFESGVHRVQRIPTTESSGRIHTSTATVAVLAEVEEVDIDIPTSDLRIDVYISAGAGGQNVQKNATAVRITHLPTGMVVACQDERSQLQNKIRAMSILRARLYEVAEEKIRSEQEESRRSQVGTGERSGKIRTYNYPQSRVTDHRIGLSNHNLPLFMEGNIEEFIEELNSTDEADRLAVAGEYSQDND